MVNTTGTTPDQKKLISVKPIYIALAVILVVALLGGSVWGIIWLARTQAAAIEAVRDVLLIALALESCLFGVVLLFMLLMIIRLVNMLEFEIKPILEKTNETVGTIRGTTTFVSKNVVKPVTEARVHVAGIRQALKSLFGNPRNNIPR
ncbi:MAG: hypothetical protein H6654_01845 [Ardenticatenaceae bacterium]|nr:hypothetical protein [Ardenticatenaceae bacterium]MCB8972267.1 hypothetical protein [Ardenticatenaceae bacterium]